MAKTTAAAKTKTTKAVRRSGEPAARKVAKSVATSPVRSATSRAKQPVAHTAVSAMKYKHPGRKSAPPKIVSKQGNARAGRQPARATKAAGSRKPDAQKLAHGLHALLHTMHTIQQFEESLCSLMHALRQGRPSAAIQRELTTVLHELPTADYRDDVESLLHALE